MRKLNFFTFCFLLIAVFSNGQANPDNFAKMVDFLPPAPNASAIIKYGGINVNKNTGAPGISIPLTQIKSKRLTCPVSLQYGATGIRVDEIASRVGMGWTIQAGGVITRTVRGTPDGTNPRLVPYAPIGTNWATANFLQKIASSDNSNGYDAEPDLFNFNFNGYSGTFVFDEQMNIVPIPYNDNVLKFESNFNGTAWNFRITTPDGIKYYFGGSGATEKTKRDQVCAKTFDVYIATSWYLTKIEHPNGDAITFTYTPLEYTYDQGSNQTMYYTQAVPPSGGALGSCANIICPNPNYSTCYNLVRTQGVLLEEINVYNSAKLKFEYITRQDCGDRLINRITLSDMNSGSPVPVKVWNLNYDQVQANTYFQNLSCNGNTKTPYLISVLERSPDSSIVLPYYFKYNDPGARPPRLSYSQDHWGYFNGKFNQYFIPKPDPSLIDRFPLATANREIDVAFAQKGMLTKVVYPTGGMDSLLYESNQYAIPNIHKPPHILQLESTGTGLWNQVVQTRSFSIDNSQNISVHLICLDNSGTGDFDSLHNKGMVEILNGTGNVVYSKLLSPGDNLTEIPNTLSAGNYTLRVTSNGSVVTTKVYQTYFPQTIDYGGYTNQVTGGLRVKSVLTANPGKQVMVKRYYYGSIDNLNVSSLYYAPTPVYKKDYLTRYMCLFGPAGTAVNYLYCQHTALYSNSQANLFAYQSSPVSYETVTESIGENFEGGGTQTKYMVGSDAAGQVLIGNDVLNAPQSNFSQIMNGKPKEELIFKKDGQGNFIPLRKTIYKYKIDSNGNKLIEGYFVTQKYDLTEVEDTTCVVQPGTECGRILDATLDAFDMIRYDIMSKWVYNDSLIEISYDQNGQNPITRLTVNYYENQQHLQLTRTETYDSKNNVIKTVMKYPGDFAGTAVYDSMVNRHIISPIIELTGYTNGTQLSDLKTNYYNWGNGNFAPQSITRSTYNNPAQSEGQFDLYDAAGNILQYTPKDGVVTSVIWGHKGYLPVAKITGANYSQVLTQMLPDTASLQNLTGYNLYSSLSPLQSSLPSSMVTIYTYKNLVGITSLTDQRGKRATYEYDAMNRLKLVRDQDSNIVRKFQYNYASAQPDIPTGVYFNSQQTGTYYSQACIAGYSSGPITYVVPAGSYYSYISQADANAKAQAEISEKGQYFVNTNSSCYMVFINDDMSQNFTRNNCSSGYQGSTVTYSVDIGTYTSIISKEDANNQALADITANGQSYANTHGTCSYIYHNVEKSGIFTRNNCGSGYTGGQVAYTVPAGTYSSLVSQADADQKAQDDINANGQNYANTNGSCTAICTNCTGENKKCINGTCATGLKVYTSSVYIGPRHYQCTYHYEWSDGSWSQDYTEDTTAPCLTAL